MSIRHPLFDAQPGFFDLARVRAASPELSGLEDDALLELLLDEDNVAPPAPNLLFDVHFYTMLRTRTGDAEPRNPVVHYLSEGAEQGLPINALFDVEFYQRNAVLEGLSPVHVVIHALAHMGPQLARFSPFVDLDFICAQTGRKKDAELLTRLLGGTLQIDRPHPLVDLDHLRRQTVRRLGTLRAALFHYWTCGEDLSTHPLIDVAHYRSGVGDGEAITHSAYHYLISHAPASPHALFDTEYYCDQVQAELGRVPGRALEHFVVEGQALGLAPSPFFDVEYYRAQSGAGPDAVQHYLQGGYRRYAPHPMICLSEARLQARARAGDMQGVAERLADPRGPVPLDLVPDFHLPFVRQEMNAQDAESGEVLRRYLREAYPEGRRPNGLLSLPYITAQSARLDVTGRNPLACYFEQGWHRRQRIMIALADLEDTTTNRAWFALCEAQLNNPQVELVVVSNRGGTLFDRFGEVAHVWCLWQPEPEDTGAFARSARTLAEVLAANPPVAGFVDFTEGAGQAQVLGRLDVPLIAFGDAGLGRLTTEEVQMLAGQVDQVLCATAGVQARLQEVSSRIKAGVRAGFHPVIAPPRPSARQRETLRSGLGIGANDVIVLSSGGEGIEHGADLFGALVAQCCEDAGIAANVRFIWHGPGHFWGNRPKFYTRHFARTVGGDTRLHMIDAPDLGTIMGAADIYVKLGRDGCPMNDVLQARAAGLPIVLMRSGRDQDGMADAPGVTAVDAFDLGAARDALRGLAAEPGKHRAAVEDALMSQLGLGSFLSEVSAAIRRHAPDVVLSAPDEEAAGRLLLILPDKALFDALAEQVGDDRDCSEVQRIPLTRRQLATDPLPPAIGALLSSSSCTELVLLCSPADLTSEDMSRFQHAIWLTEGTEAELRWLYLYGLSFDEIHSLKPGQIDAMRALNPRVAEVMRVTDWRAQ